MFWSVWDVVLRSHHRRPTSSSFESCFLLFTHDERFVYCTVQRVASFSCCFALLWPLFLGGTIVVPLRPFSSPVSSSLRMMKDSDIAQCREWHHFRDVLLRLGRCFKVAPSSSRFVHFLFMYDEIFE